ncbi:MAG: FAD-binding oxidoreductase [Curvibacter sp.]|nr:FAD-binding oxidoreductase [Curvibacter sp.]
MRNIRIVGAGQSGLQLALSLQAQGHQVSLSSNRSAEDIAHGKVMSSQCMFHTALQAERELGLNFWEAECPPVEGISLTVPHPAELGQKALAWSHRLDHPAQSVDQRLKIPGWMDAFRRRGGQILEHEATVDDLEAWSLSHDLVIVAAGKGAIAQLFERDARRSPFDKPQRALALTYVQGMRAREDYSAVDFNLIPGVGEYFVFPALSTSGPCHIMVFEGVPGGPMDCWGDVQGPAAHLARSREILARYLPWEAARCAHIELTDANGILSGRFAPTVRHPVGRLPSGRVVMGLGDAVLLNDPITGQGSNNAAKFARVVDQALAARGEQALDAGFIQSCFDSFWAYASHVVDWTNAMLMPPPDHVMAVLQACARHPAAARRFVNGFDDPRDYAGFLMDPERARAYLATLEPALA